MDEMNQGDFDRVKTDEELQNESFKDKEERIHKSFGKRIGSAMLIILGAVICVFGSVYAFLVGITFIAIGAIWEIIHVTGKKYPIFVHIVTYIFILLLTYWFFIGGNLRAYFADPANYEFSLTNYSDTLYFPFGITALFIAIYFYIVVCTDKFTFADVAHFVSLSLLVGMGIQAACYLRFHPFYIISDPSYINFQWFPEYTSLTYHSSTQWQFDFFLSALPIIYMIMGTVADDTLAWFGGMLLGKHHMNPRVSPNKTWEGFFSGIIGSTIVYAGLGFLFAGIGMPILPCLTMDKWYNIVILSIVLPFVGVLGDLSFSIIKRYYGKKDYSNLFPGHGGILDRFDSYMFSCLGMACMIMAFNGGQALIF